MDNSTSNPFYNNYVFTAWDNNRFTLHWTDKLKVLFKPMYVQLIDNYVVKYKVGGDGRIYYFGMERFNIEATDTESTPNNLLK